jgi:hypothetical protein
MREHEFPSGVPTPAARCIHCGGLWRPAMQASCVEREGARPESRPRVRAMDDMDTIYARLEELRKEREAEMAARRDE